MNTPDRLSDSLIAALSEARIPVENHAFIRGITNAAGVRRYRVVHHVGKSFVVATRCNGGRDLHIEYGATNGFASEEETIRIAPDAVGRGERNSEKGNWYVLHPVNSARVGGERSRDVRRKATFCSCGMELSLTGVCGSCD
ncbi:hypothetical protein [Mycolicibacterium septicum]|uniref:hypothetical protein n=1 Tax=Mycolicibacterium septicum TaxID=98668 RepID=UPI001AF28E02|nr:hypothetical protein [Mycolicibacterium septicum]QRY53823.1 hypothetical protein JVX95_11165 [Mycolicibacterium septicum]